MNAWNDQGHQHGYIADSVGWKILNWERGEGNIRSNWLKIQNNLIIHYLQKG